MQSFFWIKTVNLIVQQVDIVTVCFGTKITLLIIAVLHTRFSVKYLCIGFIFMLISNYW